MYGRISNKPNDTILSTEFDSLSFVLSSLAVFDVRITATYGGSLLLSERYYTAGNQFTLQGLASLVESYMRMNSYAYAEFTVQLLSGEQLLDTHTFKILYCDRPLSCCDTAQFLADNFLSTLQYRRVAPDASFTMPLYARLYDSLGGVLYYSFRSGEDVITSSMPFHENYTAHYTGVHGVDIDLDVLRYHIGQAHGIARDEVELLTFTITTGNRSATFFVDYSLRQREAFFFKNCFMADEAMYLPYSTKTKTMVERSTAVLYDRTTFYNQRTTKTYEVETGPLTSDEADWVEQVVSSPKVCRLVRIAYDPNLSDEMVEVLITDSECETTDSDEKPNSVKFTYRYADNRPLLQAEQPSELFTREFSPQFS